MKLRQRRAAALLLVPTAVVLVLSACGGPAPRPSGSSSASSSGSGAATTTALGVKVTGGFGEKPTLTLPSGSAPAELKSEVLTKGDGATVATGDLLVVNYLGESWADKKVFDNSYDRKQPTGFQIGTGNVIKGWDQALVGQKTGSRVLLSIPPKLAYGEKKDPKTQLSGEPLLFVVDILGTVGKNAASQGEAVSATTAGLPTVTSKPGQKPVITSVKGVKPGAKAVSALLVKGSGAKIDKNKQLALQIVQTDAATGKQTQETWGTKPELVPAAQVLPVVPALENATVGSRAVAVPPAQTGQAGVVVVVDVVGQY